MMRPSIFISRATAERIAATLVDHINVARCRVFSRSEINSDRSREQGYVIALYDRSDFHCGFANV
jgi:hypothetical protein